MNTWILYLYGQVDTVRVVLALLAGAALVTAVTYTCCAADERNSELKAILSRHKRGWFSVMTALAAVSALLPGSKTIAMMVVVPALVESKAIQQDLPELYELGVSALKSQLKSLPSPAPVEQPKQ